jgi:hypothetical protein
MSSNLLSPPIINNINNGVLYDVKSMPQKDITSDGTSTFSMFRNQYVKTVQSQTNATNKTIMEKKWYGGCQSRDASRIIESRKVNQIGNGSLNANDGTAISFLTKNDRNTQRDALRRVRSSGGVPAKKIHKYANAPVFY